MTEIVLRINDYVGYEFNSIQFAIRDGIPYAIDFCNAIPEADPRIVGRKNSNGLLKKQKTT